MPPVSRIDPEWLRQRYSVDLATVETIAAEAGVAVTNIYRALHRHHIPLRGPAGRARWDQILTAPALRAAHRRGETPGDIAARLGVHERVVRDRMVSLGLSAAPVDMNVAAAYQMGASLAELAAETGLSTRTIRRRLDVAGVQVRPVGRPAR